MARLALAGGLGSSGCGTVADAAKELEEEEQDEEELDACTACRGNGVATAVSVSILNPTVRC